MMFVITYLEGVIANIGGCICSSKKYKKHFCSAKNAAAA
jgi:hypothetical protein